MKILIMWIQGYLMMSLSMFSSCAEAPADLQKMIEVEFKASALPTFSETYFITYDEHFDLPAGGEIFIPVKLSLPCNYWLKHHLINAALAVLLHILLRERIDQLLAL